MTARAKSRLVAAGALAAALAAGCHAKSAGQEVTIGSLRVHLSISPDPPAVGDNHFRIALADAAGRPIAGAAVGLVWDMPAMGAMPEMRGSGQVSSPAPGTYDVAYPLPMAGDWTLTISIRPPGAPGPSIVRAKVAPLRRGFELLGASGPGGATTFMPGGGSPLAISPEQRQLIGVRYGTVRRVAATRALRASGTIDVDEAALHDVTLRYAGWIHDLYVDKTGQPVRAGQPLFTIYSPDLYSAQSDYLAALRAPSIGGTGAVLVSGARERLRLFGWSDAEIARLKARGTARPISTVYAPASGIVLDKTAVAGMRVEPGTALFRIGSLGTVWILADLYEYEAPEVAVGMPATITLPYTGEAMDGTVDYVYPTLDVTTRTLRVRIVVQNPALALKPGMYADVSIAVPLGSHLVVPSTAVLYSGLHRYVFVDEGGGALRPTEVQVGPTTGDDDVVILSGLSEGERVVTSGNFLIDSDARLQNALPRWTAPAPASTPASAPATPPAAPGAPAAPPAHRMPSREMPPMPERTPAPPMRAASRPASDGLSIALTPVPDPPVVGDDHLLVVVHDARGQPVDGATVTMTYAMPPVGPMAAMKGPGQVSAEGGGRYDVSYPVMMAGTWTLTVRAIPPGGGPGATVRATISPQHPGVRILSTTGVIGGTP